MTTPTKSRGITETDVWRAADTLLLDGARPTIERVRHKIGRGSPNTVSPHLETWFRSLGARIADPKAFSAPPSLPDPITQAASHFWEAALAVARTEGLAALHADRAEIARVRMALDREDARQRIEADKILIQAQAKEEAMQVLRSRAEEATEQLKALSAEIDERNKTISALRVELAQLRLDRENLRLQVDRDRAMFEAARHDLDTRMSSHDERWAMEVARAREATKAANTRLVHLEKESVHRVGQLTQSLETSERNCLRIAELQQQSEATIAHLQQAHAAAIRAQKDLQERTHEREMVLNAQCERIQAQLSDALSQLESKDREHGEMLRALVANARAKPHPIRRPRNTRSN